MATRKKKAEPVNVDDGIWWRIKFRGTPIRIGLRDLTVQRLRQQKEWFGEAYGTPTEFLRLLLVNECDAMACAVWIGMQKAGKAVEDARDLDFNLEDDFEALEDTPPPVEEKKSPPTEEETVSPSSDSVSGA